VQGGAGARGPFTDMLDELTSALRDKAREAVERDDEVAAFRYSVAVGYVEEAKERANDNVNPQLVTAALVRALERESAR
jgi:DNA polymerase III subunit delta'